MQKQLSNLMHVSFLIQSEGDVSAFSELEIAQAKHMYNYVFLHSQAFACSRKWLSVLWEAAYFDMLRTFRK